MDKETLQEIILQQLIDNAFNGFVENDVIVTDDNENSAEDEETCLILQMI